MKASFFIFILKKFLLIFIIFAGASYFDLSHEEQRSDFLGNKWSIKKLSIGEISKMHNVSIKMLRYWDEIGLFKPIYIDPDTGYRYYSTYQFHTLNVIIYMKKLGLSYAEIKEHLSTQDYEYHLELFKKHLELTNKKIEELNSIKENLSGYVDGMEEVLKIKELDEVTVKSYPETKIILIKEKIYSRIEFEKTVKKLEKIIFGNPTLLLPKVSLIIDKNNFLDMKFDEYDGAFITAEEYEAKKEFIQILPAGEYASICFWAKLEDSLPFFIKIKNYIDEHGYEVKGDIIRRVVAPGVFQNDRGHLGEIRVPIKKK